jgi:hypothetical protein
VGVQNSFSRSCLFVDHGLSTNPIAALSLCSTDASKRMPTRATRRASDENASVQKNAPVPLEKDPVPNQASIPVPHAILEAAGLSISAEGSFLVSDGWLFRQNVKTAVHQPGALDDLLAALTEAWSDPRALRAALLPTRAPPGGSSASGALGGALGGVADSVIRLLLQCETLQTPLAQQLLEALPEHQDELETAAPHSGMPLPKLVLSQFRWLEHVVDGGGEPVPVRIPFPRSHYARHAAQPPASPPPPPRVQRSFRRSVRCCRWSRRRCDGSSCSCSQTSCRSAPPSPPTPRTPQAAAQRSDQRA